MQAVCDILERLLIEGVFSKYALGGATAAGFHGEPLATRDIDVFVFLDPVPGQLLLTLEPIYARLADLGYTEFEEEGVLIEDFPVQFLSASPGLESDAVEEAIKLQWDGHVLRVMTPEYLAAIALSVGRPKDRARLVYLVMLPDFDKASFLEILRRHTLDARWKEWSVGLGLG